MKQKTELHLNQTEADSPKLPEITKMVGNFTKVTKYLIKLKET